MNLEELTQLLTSKMPKPMLVFVIIAVSIIFFMVLSPPHTICDTQKENLRANQKGVLFPTKVGKYTYPGQILKVRESCRFGNSSGACYEYFAVLKKVAQAVKNGSAECYPKMLSAKVEKYEKTESYETVGEGKLAKDEVSGISYKDVNVEKVFLDGLEMMVLKAWGEKTPPPGVERFGWFQEYEMSIFCHIQDVIKEAKGEVGYKKLQKEIFKKLPGDQPMQLVAQLLPEQEILKRSLFNVTCSRFR